MFFQTVQHDHEICYISNHYSLKKIIKQWLDCVDILHNEGSVKGIFLQLQFDVTVCAVCRPEDSPPGPAPALLGLSPGPPLRPGPAHWLGLHSGTARDLNIVHWNVKLRGNIPHLQCDVTVLTVLPPPQHPPPHSPPALPWRLPAPPAGPLCRDPLSAHYGTGGGVVKNYAARPRLARNEVAAVVDATLVLRLAVRVVSTVSVTVTARVAITAVVVFDFIFRVNGYICVSFLKKVLTDTKHLFQVYFRLYFR